MINMQYEALYCAISVGLIFFVLIARIKVIQTLKKMGVYKKPKRKKWMGKN